MKLLNKQKTQQHFIATPNQQTQHTFQYSPGSTVNQTLPLYKDTCAISNRSAPIIMPIL